MFTEFELELATCESDPRLCENIWINPDFSKGITQPSGGDQKWSVESEHHINKILNLTCNQAGSSITDYLNYSELSTAIIEERNICN